MSQENQEIRKSAQVAGVRNWEIAEYIGVSEGTLCRWMRRELPEDKKRQILAAIILIADGRKGTKN